ncbi:putative holin-like toxin [Lentibacillus sp. N15]
MTTYKVLSLLAQFGLLQIAMLTLIFMTVVYLIKKVTAHPPRSAITSM